MHHPNALGCSPQVSFTKLILTYVSFTPYDFSLSRFFSRLLQTNKFLSFENLKCFKFGICFCAYTKVLTVYSEKYVTFLISQDNWCSNLSLRTTLMQRLVLTLLQVLKSKLCQKDTDLQAVTLDTPKEFLHPKWKCALVEVVSD